MIRGRSAEAAPGRCWRLPPAFLPHPPRSAGKNCRCALAVFVPLFIYPSPVQITTALRIIKARLGAGDSEKEWKKSSRNKKRLRETLKTLLHRSARCLCPPPGPISLGVGAARCCGGARRVLCRHAHGADLALGLLPPRPRSSEARYAFPVSWRLPHPPHTSSPRTSACSHWKRHKNLKWGSAFLKSSGQLNTFSRSDRN